ncbi:MAG: IS21-like element helper ATPase IstB [Coriobacteriales bacterium]|jgi:DNA replication protein DnaC|nr:IS21-like element helper ATPase IstB [Coriobacteriales bacterium]
MSGIVKIEALTAMMESFGLKHAPRQLADIMESSEASEATYREFLHTLLTAEVKGRNERKRKRNYAAAHFPPNVRDIAEFDCTELESGITPGQIAQLEELNWLDAKGNIIFAGPPGLGKTMLSVGLGLHAVNEGYTVAFEKMDDLVGILDSAETERNAGFRLRYIRRCQLCIIDEIGYTPISRTQANRFFNFISDTYERTSIIFTTNKQMPEWAEMMGDPVLTTAMMDRILHHARCFSLSGKSYRLKYPDILGDGNRPQETDGEG